MEPLPEWGFTLLQHTLAYVLTAARSALGRGPAVPVGGAPPDAPGKYERPTDRAYFHGDMHLQLAREARIRRLKLEKRFRKRKDFEKRHEALMLKHGVKLSELEMHQDLRDFVGDLEERRLLKNQELAEARASVAVGGLAGKMGREVFRESDAESGKSGSVASGSARRSVAPGSPRGSASAGSARSAASGSAASRAAAGSARSGSAASGSAASRAAAGSARSGSAASGSAAGAGSAASGKGVASGSRSAASSATSKSSKGGSKSSSAASKSSKGSSKSSSALSSASKG